MAIARKILFYVFVLFYLILCPIIILYSFGYIYQPKTKDISQTGILYLSTIPPGAHIYLEKSRFKDTTPAAITELNPGSYQVNLRLKDFRQWTHHITIEPGKSLAFKNILLVPDRFQKINISPDRTYRDLTLINKSKYLILSAGGKINEFYTYDMRRDELRALTGNDPQYAEFSVNAVFSEETSNFIVIYGGSLWGKQYLLINLDAESFSPKEITKLFSRPPDRLIWNNDIPDDIFAAYDNSIDRLDIPNVSVYPKYLDNIKGLGISDKRLYTLSLDNAITRSTLDKEQVMTLFEDEHLGKNLFSKSPFYHITELDKKVLIFRGAKGDLIATIPPYRILEEGVLGIEFDQSGDRLLCWTRNDIWLAELNKKDEMDLLFQERVLLKNVYRKGADISQCFWVYAGAQLLFKDKSDVFLLELAPDGNHHKENIVTVKQNTDILYNKTDGSLYYIDQEGHFMKIAILTREKTFFETRQKKKAEDSYGF